MQDRVEIEVKDGVAEVALARPDKKNALDPAMFEAIVAAGNSLKGRADVRVVILYGQGDSFCAGIDTSTFGEMIGKIDEIRTRMLNLPEGEVANPWQKPSTVWQELGVPVIAALTGVTYGGGAQIALGADFRIAAPDLKFSIMEAKWGLIPDMGLTQSLWKLVRADQAKDLMMTARVLDASEALALGLVTRIADTPLEAARAYAGELLKRSPQVLRDAKRLVDETWTAAPGAGLKLEADLQARIIGSPNQVESVMANVQKRAPVYK
jgi:enoyl-CoA hydratase/carnithine racemase